MVFIIRNNAIAYVAEKQVELVRWERKSNNSTY